jgi:replication factor C subunit 1
MEDNGPVNDMLWADKYRPRSTRDLVGNKSNIDTVKNWLQHWNAGNEKAKKGSEKAVLLSGPPGIGLKCFIPEK